MSLNIEELIDALKPLGVITNWAPVGSRVTCRPAPTNTDADYLLLVGVDGVQLLQADLVEHGWSIGGSKPVLVDEVDFKPDEDFTSFTRGELNLIVTASPLFYNRFLAATEVSKALNIMVKADRISLFQAVLYGKRSGDVPSYLVHQPGLCPPAVPMKKWEEDLDELIR